MQNLSDISVVRSVLSRHGFNFSKALGQNFLINPTVCPRMAENCGADENTGVIEIGAGIGVLTAALAKRAKKVVSIELDTRLLPVLEETLSDFDNIEVVNADVMKTDLHALIEEKFQGMDVVVCANLPYYITSPIITMLLEEKLPIKAITVMIQKEAADRLSTPVGSRDSGAITVCTNYYAEVKHLFNVSRGSFMPPPNVDSAVIKLTLRDKPPVKVADEKLFFKLVKACFAQRRKILLNTVCNTMGISKDSFRAALNEAGVSETVRGETLTMEQLAAISNALCE